MNKKVLKVISIIAMIMMIVSISVVSFAADAQGPSVLNGSGYNNVNGINEIGNKIVGFLRACGIVLSVVILIIIGIKYMLGSAEEKADYKKTLMPYFIGAVLIFAASTFAQAIFDFVNGF